MAEMADPMYGTNRSSVPSTPHRIGDGTPMKYRPMATMTPKAVLMPSWVRKYVESLPGGVVHSDRGAVEVGRAEQADHAVTQVLALHQQEDDHDQDDAERGQRRDDRLEHLLRDDERRGLLLRQTDQERLLLRGACVLRGGRGGVTAGRRRVLVDRDGRLVDQRGGVPQDSGLQPLDLGLHRVLVLRQLPREVGELQADDTADAEQHGEGEHDRHQDRGNARHVDAAQQVHDGAEHEGEQHRQDERDEHLLAEVQRHDDDDGDRQRGQAGRAGRRGGLHLGRTKRNGRKFFGQGQVSRFRHSDTRVLVDGNGARHPRVGVARVLYLTCGPASGSTWPVAIGGQACSRRTG